MQRLNLLYHNTSPRVSNFESSQVILAKMIHQKLWEDFYSEELFFCMLKKSLAKCSAPMPFFFMQWSQGKKTHNIALLSFNPDRRNSINRCSFHSFIQKTRWRRLIFYPLVHVPNAGHSQGCVRPEPGAGNSIWVFEWQEPKHLGYHVLAFRMHINRQLDQMWHRNLNWHFHCCSLKWRPYKVSYICFRK